MWLRSVKCFVGRNLNSKILYFCITEITCPMWRSVRINGRRTRRYSPRFRTILHSYQHKSTTICMNITPDLDQQRIHFQLTWVKDVQADLRQLIKKILEQWNEARSIIMLIINIFVWSRFHEARCIKSLTFPGLNTSWDWNSARRDVRRGRRWDIHCHKWLLARQIALLCGSLTMRALVTLRGFVVFSITQ
jgi:hypothetical protein